MMQRLLSTVIASSTLLIAASDGQLNPRFGVNGQVITPPIVGSDLTTSLAIQPDGKLLVLTTFFTSTVYRYNPDGSLDTSFGNQGSVTISMYIDFANKILLYPDGSLIVSGLDNGGANFVFIHLLADGSLDSSFGVSGVATFPVGASESSALQKDGKIVSVGFDTPNAVVIRVLPNGALDHAFPPVITTYAAQVAGSTQAHLYDVSIDQYGRIVVGGSVTVGGQRRFLLARYLPNGNLDSSFGNQGVTVTDVTPGEDSVITGVQIVGNGSIIVYGLADAAGNVALAKYTNRGRLDLSFGDNGIARTMFSLSPGLTANKPLIQSDGKIVAFVRESSSVTVFRMNHNGTLDATFGTNGSFELVTDYAFAMASAIDATGQIYIGANNISEQSGAVLSLMVRSLCYSPLSQALWQRYYNRITP